MRVAFNIFRFSTSTLKAAKLKEYHIPALNPSNAKSNTLWLHGMFDCAKNYFNIVQDESLRTLTNQTIIEARNHGYSQHTETMTFNELAHDLVEYIAKKDLKDLFLVGHSLGGRTIMTALKNNHNFLADRIKGVVIVDVMPTSYADAGTGPLDQMYRFMQEMKSINIVGRTFAEVEKEVKSKFQQESIQTTILQNIQVLSNGQLRWCVNLNAFDRSYNDLITHETKDCYWTGPRKIIIGGKSKFTSVERVSKDYPSVFTDLNLQRDLVVFEDSAHFLHAKEPVRFAKEVSQFIQRVEDEEYSLLQNSNNNNQYANESLALDI